MERVRDEHGIVVSWILQILLVVALVGGVLFEAGSIAWNYFGVESAADEIALELSDTIEQSRVTTPQLVQQEARRLARERGARLVGQVVFTEDSIELKIRREANTLVIGRIDATADWAVASATGSASTS